MAESKRQKVMRFSIKVGKLQGELAKLMTEKVMHGRTGDGSLADYFSSRTVQYSRHRNHIDNRIARKRKEIETYKARIRKLDAEG